MAKKSEKINWNNRLACDVIANPPATFEEATLLEAWQFIIRNGFVWQLNDYFQRTAIELVTSGYCLPTKWFWTMDIPEDFPPDYLPPRKEPKSPLIRKFVKVVEKYKEDNYNEWKKNRKEPAHEKQEPTGEDPGDSDS